MPLLKNKIAIFLWGHKEILANSGLWVPIMKIYSNVRRWEELHDNIILHKYNAIYFPIPKIACSSLKSVCAQLLNTEKGKAKEDERVHYIQFPTASKSDIYGKYRHYFKFAFIRNPWDRIISLYKGKMIHEPDESKMQAHRHFLASLKKHRKFRLGMSFEEFVEAVAQITDVEAHDHFRSQYIFLTDHQGHHLVDFIGRFENLSQDFSRILERLGIKDINLPQLMKSNRGHYRHYYSLKTKELVARRYAKDIEMYGYEF